MENNPAPVDMDLIDLDGSNSAAESSSDEINSRFAKRISSQKNTHISKFQSPLELPDERSSDSSWPQRISTRDTSSYQTEQGTAYALCSNSNSSYDTTRCQPGNFVTAGNQIASVGSSNPGSISDENSSCSSPIRRNEETQMGRSHSPTCQSQCGSVARSSVGRRKDKDLLDCSIRSRRDNAKTVSSDRKRTHRRRQNSTADSDDSRACYKQRHRKPRKSSRHRHRRSSPTTSRRLYPRDSQSKSSLSPTQRYVNPYAVKAFKDFGAINGRPGIKQRDVESRNVDIEVEKRVRAKIEQRVAEELEKRKAQIHAEVRSKIAQEQTRMYAELKSELEIWRNEERRKMLQQEDEQKRKREELEILIAENNRKIEEQHRRIAEEHMRLLDEQRKLVEQKERIEAEQKRRATDEQAMILGKRGTRPKLSFQLGQKFLN